jgi:hypothetical protein
MNTLIVIGTLALEKANQPFLFLDLFYVIPSKFMFHRQSWGGECLTDRNEDKRREIRPDLAQVSRLWDYFPPIVNSPIVC